MKKRIAGFVAGLLVSVLIAPDAGAEMLMKGSGHYRSGRSAKVDVLKLGKERLQINFDETGVVVDAPADSPFHNASFNTMGTVQVVSGKLTYNGSALWTRPNGERIFGTFTGKGTLGKGSSGFLEIVGGEGECAGIRGTMEMKSGPYVKSSKKGYSMGTTEGTINWEIP